MLSTGVHNLEDNTPNPNEVIEKQSGNKQFDQIWEKLSQMGDIPTNITRSSYEKSGRSISIKDGERELTITEVPDEGCYIEVRPPLEGDEITSIRYPPEQHFKSVERSKKTAEEWARNHNFFSQLLANNSLSIESQK